jgi:hypothetical protein
MPACGGVCLRVGPLCSPAGSHSDLPGFVAGALTILSKRSARIATMTGVEVSEWGANGECFTGVNGLTGWLEAEEFAN